MGFNLMRLFREWVGDLVAAISWAFSRLPRENHYALLKIIQAPEMSGEDATQWYGRTKEWAYVI
jgi:hypothetical protein